MSKELVILLACWGIAIVFLIFGSKGKIREASVIFFFKQLLTWLLGLAVVELRLIEYPYRFFSYASRTSFSFEYFLYPATCVIFVLKYPEKKGKWARITWYLFFSTWMTIAEVIFERTTLLVHYIHWTWYYTWISLLLTFYLSHQYYLWFFKKRKTASLTDSARGGS